MCQHVLAQRICAGQRLHLGEGQRRVPLPPHVLEQPAPGERPTRASPGWRSRKRVNAPSAPGPAAEARGVGLAQERVGARGPHPRGSGRSGEEPVLAGAQFLHAPGPRSGPAGPLIRRLQQRRPHRSTASYFFLPAILMTATSRSAATPRPPTARTAIRVAD